jgi:hypothetical protein
MKNLFFALLFIPLMSISQDDADRYKLYKTDNMWTLLKLDTATGKISQVQSSIEGNQFQVTLNDIDYSGTDEIEIGRFELYPTGNMYNFLMLDQIDGAVYQMQWSTNIDNRGTMFVYSNGIEDTESTKNLKKILEDLRLEREMDSINNAKVIVKDSIN